jgi:hypothetical protein
MDDRRPETTIAGVNAWQRHPRLTPLLCVYSTHRPLVPVEADRRVVLRCPDCEYRHNYIPSSVIHALWTDRFQ